MSQGPSRWSEACEAIFRAAKARTETLQHGWLGTEHVALGMLDHSGSILVRRLKAHNVKPKAVESRIIEDMKGVESERSPGQLPITPRLSHIVAAASARAASQSRDTIEEEDLLEALMRGGPGTACRALRRLGLEPEALLSDESGISVNSMSDTVVDKAAAPRVRPIIGRAKPPPRPRVEVPMLPMGGANPVLIDFGIIERPTLPKAPERPPDLDELLHDGIVGQAEAVEAILERMRMARSGLRDEGRPLSVFVFMGPAGVGKTETARLLARGLFGGEAYHVLDEPDEGRLAALLSRQPRCVVHLAWAGGWLAPLLKLARSGRLDTADGTQAVFVLSVDTDQTELPPSWRDAVDEVVVFKPLEPLDVLELVRREVRSWGERVARSGVTLEVAEDVLQHLAEKGFTSAAGARPLRKAVEQHLAAPLSRQLLQKGYRGRVQVQLVDGALAFEPKEAGP